MFLNQTNNISGTLTVNRRIHDEGASVPSILMIWFILFNVVNKIKIKKALFLVKKFLV